LRREAFAIFAIALSVRLLFATLRSTHGLWGPPQLQVEIFSDFNDIYVTQLHQISQGMLPYRDFAYSYPPLFLYALYPFYSLGGATLAWLPIVLSDAGSAVVVYLLLQRYADRKIAIAGGLVYALSPLMVLYEGYLWFSSQPMVFFLLLSFYLLQLRRVPIAAVCFGIAVLFKQDALFLVPAYLVAQWSTSPRQTSRAVAIASLTVLAGCLPFLILAPSQFLVEISFTVLEKVGLPPLAYVQSGNGLIAATSIAPGACATFSTSALTSICASVVNQSVLSSSLSTLYLILNDVAGLILLPFALLVGVALYSVRRRRGFVFLIGAYSSAVIFVLFALTIHPGFYRYYFLALYSMLLAASWKRSLLVVVIATMLVSLLTPSGIFQELLPMFALLSMVILVDLDTESSSFESRESY